MVPRATATWLAVLALAAGALFLSIQVFSAHVVSAEVLSSEVSSDETAPVADLPGWAASDPRPALRAFRASCPALAIRPARLALRPPPGLASACAVARDLGQSPDADRTRRFFETRFDARRVAGDAFFTGYFEPVVEGSLARTPGFATPLYGEPPGLVHAAPGRPLPGLDPLLTVARRLADGRLAALPDRAAIVAGALEQAPLRQAPLVYVREPVEAFLIQVQGSARLRLRDGRLRRLAYAGRNGHPYTSIGKILVDRLHVPPSQMGMAQLEAWIRDNGQAPDQPGGLLMQENRSYVFFKFDDALASSAGPVGGAGVSLTPMVSLAIDRTRWPYGLPFYVDTTLPGPAPDPFRRLMVAQDTGSAILGAARADIFFGTGPSAAAHAGPMREHGTLYVLWPKAPAPKQSAPR